MIDKLNRYALNQIILEVFHKSYMQTIKLYYNEKENFNPR